jgi:NAD(P)-dependent dehydrogenase (short-subunit alcohol dehydrogenase family)
MEVYAASKNAVRTITEALRQEAGPHLRVTEVSPGFVATDFVESITDEAVKAAIKQRGAGMAISPDSIHSAMRRSCLPSLRPSNSRRRVAGAFSRPFCTSTLVLIFPDCTQPASAPIASAARGR